MSEHEFPSGNLARDGGLIKVVQAAQANGEPITVANISLHCRQEFGDTFTDVSENELAECVAYLGPPPEVETAAVIEPPHEPEAQSERAPPTMSYDEAVQMVADAQQNLYAARRELTEAAAAQKTARGTLSQAVMAWQRGGTPQLTPEENKRQYIASENARRAAGIPLNGRTQSPGGPSAYDMGRAGYGSSVNRRFAPTRRGLVPGQKAYSLHEAMARSGSARVDVKGAAPIPAVRPPSER